MLAINTTTRAKGTRKGHRKESGKKETETYPENEPLFPLINTSPYRFFIFPAINSSVFSSAIFIYPSTDCNSPITYSKELNKYRAVVSHQSC